MKSSHGSRKCRRKKIAGNIPLPAEPIKAFRGSGKKGLVQKLLEERTNDKIKEDAKFISEDFWIAATALIYRAMLIHKDPEFCRVAEIYTY